MSLNFENNCCQTGTLCDEKQSYQEFPPSGNPRYYLYTANVYS